MVWSGGTAVIAAIHSFTDKAHSSLKSRALGRGVNENPYSQVCAHICAQKKRPISEPPKSLNVQHYGTVHMEHRMERFSIKNANPHEPCWTRTSDPLLKRQMLYRLS